jgi:hypothetical protein
MSSKSRIYTARGLELGISNGCNGPCHSAAQIPYSHEYVNLRSAVVWPVAAVGNSKFEAAGRIPTDSCFRLLQQYVHLASFSRCELLTEQI